MHDYDFIETIRRIFAPPLGKLLTGVKRAKTGPDQFVGVVDMPVEDFEDELHKMGAERDVLAYWKYVPGMGGEDGSWRFLDGDYQIHVILYNGHPDKSTQDTEGKTYIYAHWEDRWDVHPLMHLREVHMNVQKGVNQMRTKLNLASIPYKNDRTVQ